MLELVVKDIETRSRYTPVNLSDQAFSLAASILSKSILALLSVKEDTLKFLDIFYEAIGNATDEYNVFSRKFKEQANKELSHHLDGADNPIDYDNETTDADKILRKTDQIRLAIQIEDIVDELEMLKQLFTIQLSILKRG